MKFRIWLIKLLLNGDGIAMNLHLLRGIYIDCDKTKGFITDNINIRYKDDLPNDTALYVYYENK